jgi:FtsP/CotA-like multicopper oxidase with cupredoxin domain
MTDSRHLRRVGRGVAGVTGRSAGIARLRPASLTALAFTLGCLGLAGCGGGGGGGSGIDAIEVRSSSNGILDTTLTVAEATTQIGAVTAVTATYEGRIPGPILRLKPGDLLRIHLDNQLPPAPVPLGPMMHDSNATNLHFHGLHAPPTGIADNVFVEVAPGASFDYEVPIPADHPGGFFWYHPHFHGNVTHQLGSGMAGGLVIEGDLDQVPEVAAARERFLVLNELTLDATGHVPPLHSGVPTTSTLLVNGLSQPDIDIRPGEVQRWRIVAANGDRFFLLQLDGHQMHQIALDGIPFANAVAQDQILVLPGNRVEVMVQGGPAGTYPLKALYYDRGGVHPPVPEVVLANLVVSGKPASGQLPGVLVAPPPGPPVPAAQSRFFDFDQIAPEPDPVFAVNGNPFDPDVVVAQPVLGTTEEWIVTDVMNEEHPFHLHTHPFQVIEVNGLPVANPVWQDTARIPKQGFIFIRIAFRDFPGKTVFHCHITPHEDRGMMAAYEAVP